MYDLIKRAEQLDRQGKFVEADKVMMQVTAELPPALREQLNRIGKPDQNRLFHGEIHLILDYGELDLQNARNNKIYTKLPDVLIPQKILEYYGRKGRRNRHSVPPIVQAYEQVMAGSAQRIAILTANLKKPETIHEINRSRAGIVKDIRDYFNQPEDFIDLSRPPYAGPPVSKVPLETRSVRQILELLISSGWLSNIFVSPTGRAHRNGFDMTRMPEITMALRQLRNADLNKRGDPQYDITFLTKFVTSLDQINSNLLRLKHRFENEFATKTISKTPLDLVAELKSKGIDAISPNAPGIDLRKIDQIKAGAEEVVGDLNKQIATRGSADPVANILREQVNLWTTLIQLLDEYNNSQIFRTETKPTFFGLGSKKMIRIPASALLNMRDKKDFDDYKKLLRRKTGMDYTKFVGRMGTP